MKSSDAAKRWDLLERCERARDAKFSPQEEAELEIILRDDPEMRTLFAQSLQLDAELRFDPRLVRDLQASAPTDRGRKNVIPFITFAAAACLLLGTVIFTMAKPKPAAGPATVATVVKANGCKWAGSTLPTAEGSRIVAGTLELVEGLATLRFDSGAEVVLEAPATLEIIDAMNCRLKSGTLVADVPHTAIGFTVDTKDAKVVDLGTRFGVSADDQGKYLVHVIEGLVEVGHKGEDKIKRVTTGQNLDRGMLKEQLNPQTSPDEPNRWQPDQILHDNNGWHTISSAFGGGKDSFVQSTKSPQNFGSEPFMRVKNTTIQVDLVRKGYVAFDLSKFDQSKIEDAEISLSIEPSDLGFATLVPDATFSVYGLTDESEDSWNEHEIHWKNAPARNDDPATRHLPNPAKTVLLGTFSIPQGANRGARSISGKSVADFLRSDTNGIATFIVCRETDETAKTGLVHAFSTRENRSNTPPLLRVKLRD